MPIPVEAQELLRQCSQHETAYQKLLALFEDQQAALEKHILALTTLQAGALEITTDMDIPTVLHRMMRRATDLFNAERGGGIYLYDAAKNVLQLKEAAGINEGRIGITLQLDEGVAGRVFQTGQPLIVNDYTAWDGRATVLVEHPPSAVMGVPLRIQGQVAGALLVVTNSHERIFGQEDVRLAEMFAAQAAIALRNAQLYSAAQREIAERIEAEEALLERERRIRALIEAIPDLILRIRADGTFLDYHASDPALLLMPPEAFLGKTVVEVMSEFFAQTSMPVIQQVVTNQQASKYEYELPLQQGVRQFETRIVPAGPDEVLFIARDVTEQRRAQQRELDLALEKERVNLVTTFIQNAAHEFRTPLAAINSFAYLMSQTDDPERRTFRFDQIRMQVKRITTLVNMLLTTVRLDSSDEIACVPVDMGVILETVCRKLASKYGDKPELRVEVQAGLPSVMGNADYLATAVEQLLDNAYGFTPPDGRITVAAGAAHDEAWLEVHDTGPGISKEALPHIFETFWRQDAAHTVPGFGLGLPMAQKIIARHGGQITVETTLQQGTCFRITLPLLSQGFLASDEQEHAGRD